MAAPTRTKEIFSELIENLALVTDQLNNEIVERDAVGFEMENFWQRMNAAVKCVSKECTKLVLAFSEPPHPSDSNSQMMVSVIERTTLALISIYYTLPKVYGASLMKCVTDAVKTIVEGVSTLVQSIKTQVLSGNNDPTLISTGCLWKACEAFQSLPKSNRDLVMRHLKENLELIIDAIDELEEAVNSEGTIDCPDDGDNVTDDWSDNDRAFVSPCIGLMKCSRGLLKKLPSAIKTVDCDSVLVIHDLDNLYERIKRLSPVTDDLAMSLYPPITHTVVLNHMLENEEILNNTLEFVRQSHLITESDAAWIQLLSNAVQHNTHKAKTLGAQ